MTIDDIGAAVAMSGPGLYRHFPGKEAVLAEMLVGISERLLAEGSRRVVAAPDPAAAPAARLRTAVHAVFGLLNSTPHSAGEQPKDAAAVLLRAMARAALAAAAESPPAPRLDGGDAGADTLDDTLDDTARLRHADARPAAANRSLTAGSPKFTMS